MINEKMAKTFSLRRNDVILNKPAVIDFKARWPALFEFSQVCSFSSLKEVFMVKSRFQSI